MSSAKERAALGNAAGYLRETVSTWVNGVHRRKILALADEIDPDVEDAEVVSVQPESTVPDGEVAQPRLTSAEQVAKDKSDAATSAAAANTGQRVEESGLTVADASQKDAAAAAPEAAATA